MKKILQIVVIVFFTITTQAQINWNNNLDDAINTGIRKGKLILVDFWASWCGPCLTMDKELWSLPEMSDLSKNFVAARINVDIDQPTALDFQVQGIPKVVLILPNKEVVWERTGFAFVTDYLNVIKGLPSDVSELYRKIELLGKNKNDVQLNFNAGIEFQNAGRKTGFKTLSDEFYSQGQLCFKRALKNCTIDSIKYEIGLFSVLTDVYKNNPKKALKNLEDISKPASESPHSVQLAHFIRANCYKLLKDDQNYLKEKELITHSDFLEALKE